jgi:hypothetical protein
MVHQYSWPANAPPIVILVLARNKRQKPMEEIEIPAELNLEPLKVRCRALQPRHGAVHPILNRSLAPIPLWPS